MKTPIQNAPLVDLDRLVSRWLDTAIRVQDTFGKIENAFMASPENEIRSAIWDMFGEYTRTLAAQLSDDAEDARGWLEWFAWECDFGRKPMEMVFADGETLMVVGASDLLAAIRADENGCRVWDSPANAEVSHGDRSARPILAQCKCPRAIREHGRDGCTEPDYIIHRGCPECGKPWSKFLPQNALMVRLYNQGYHAGHHDTVEGGYVDIFTCDMDTYHADVVAEIIKENENSAGAAAHGKKMI